jgi:hypothetical protein
MAIFNFMGSSAVLEEKQIPFGNDRQKSKGNGKNFDAKGAKKCAKVRHGGGG